jgi:cold-inducible RNA-binding protein
MTNIYVGNLVWACTNEDLMTLFGQYGQVAKAQIIMDRETGRSRGFAFVEMPDANEAKTAIEALNGADFNGRALTVNEAKPREPKAFNRSGGYSDRGGYRGAPRY